jgi:hypothetical protein
VPELHLKTVQALSLPAGNWLVNVTAVVDGASFSTSGGFVRCQLFAAGRHVGATIQVAIPATPSVGGSVPYSGAVTLSTATTVSFDCAGDPTLQTQPSTMTAIRTGSLTIVN